MQGAGWGVQGPLTHCPAPAQSLSSTVELQHSALPPGVSVTYESHCGPGAEEAGPPQAEGGRCSGVHINEQVSQGC